MATHLPSCLQPRRFWLPVAFLIALAAIPALAQTDRPPLNAATALADLAKLEAANRRAIEEQRKEAIAALRRAAAGSGASAQFYEEAVEANGEPNFAEWKKRNADLLRAKPFQQSVQLHLRYLLLSLEHENSDDAELWAGPSLQYARELAGVLTDKDFREGPGQARDILARKLVESPFVRWMQLGPLLPPADTWEQIPGNLGGILERNVRQPWRQVGDARVDAAWQLELETGAALATAEKSERAIDDFNSRTAPSLQFRRARDRTRTGQPNRAAADILDLARQYPDHPEFPQWAATLREMLQKKPTE